MASTTVGLKLDEATRERLRGLAKLKDRSPHWLMKKAVEEYVAREVAYEREKQEDAARWQRFQETGEHISQDDMTAWLDGLAETAAKSKLR